MGSDVENFGVVGNENKKSVVEDRRLLLLVLTAATAVVATDFPGVVLLVVVVPLPVGRRDSVVCLLGGSLGRLGWVLASLPVDCSAALMPVASGSPGGTVDPEHSTSVFELCVVLVLCGGWVVAVALL